MRREGWRGVGCRSWWIKRLRERSRMELRKLRQRWMHKARESKTTVLWISRGINAIGHGININSCSGHTSTNSRQRHACDMTDWEGVSMWLLQYTPVCMAAAQGCSSHKHLGGQCNKGSSVKPTHIHECVFQTPQRISCQQICSNRHSGNEGENAKKKLMSLTCRQIYSKIAGMFFYLNRSFKCEMNYAVYVLSF